jgi:seryl-tRNA synthetase
MIDIKLLEKDRENPQSYFQAYKKSLENRGASSAPLEEVMALNTKRKKAITDFETLRAEQNKISGEIGKLKKEGKDASEVMGKVEQIKAQLKSLEEESARYEQATNNILITFPNKCHESVPFGKSGDDNKIIKSVGEARVLPFTAKEHWELGESLKILDFERAGKVTGTRFTFLKGRGAQMERALVSFFLDLHTQKHGYTEMVPPYMVNSASYFGTGQFPKFINEVFHLTDTDYHLISTAEVPVTNYYAGEILSEEDLPISYAAYSPCFRSEAGASGKDTKGLIRQHQFHKVELLKFSHPATSYELHEKLTADAEQVLIDLELPFRRALLCTGDIGFGAAKCFDLEVWLPGAGLYREISSCSNFEDFQARRANIRFRPKGGGKPEFVHTLNGSGLAVGRTLVAILENYQKEDGSVAIPKALQKYMGGATEIR